MCDLALASVAIRSFIISAFFAQSYVVLIDQKNRSKMGPYFYTVYHQLLKNGIVAIAQQTDS